MVQNAEGIRKQTVIAKQVSLGTPKTGAGGQILRRETSVFQLNKATYESTEIVSHQQGTGSRHGLQDIAGKINGLLSPGTYKLLMQSMMRKDYVAGVNSTALTNVTAASTGGAGGTYTRGAGSFLTDGFKVFDVIRWVGWTTTGVPNNTRNFLITALSATVMTGQHIDGPPATAVGAKAAGDSVTATVVGKKTFPPLTGHTDDLYTVEEWYADISQSEMFSDLKPNMMTLDLPASGNAKISFDLIGLLRTLNVAQQLTTPTAETVTPILAAVQGILFANGVAQATITGFQIKAEGGVSADGPVVGSNVSPDLSRGRLRVSGQFTAFFFDNTLPVLYQAETVLSLFVILTADTTAAPDFVAFNMGRVKLGSDTPDDGEKGIVRTYSYVAEINSAGGAGLANDQTIMTIQDSQA